MRLLNFLVEHLPDAALWLHAPQGLKRQLSPAICTTVTTVVLPVGTSINAVTATYAKRDQGSVCTATVSVNLTTVTSINSLTSTYNGPPASQSSAPVRPLFISRMLKTVLVEFGGDNESVRFVVLYTKRLARTHPPYCRHICTRSRLESPSIQLHDVVSIFFFNMMSFPNALS
jgi:hypothetical protein